MWNYRTRANDQGSLVKIQKIEEGDYDLGTIYHVSVIGIHMANPAITPVIAHTPVAASTLDASVTSIARDPGTFPDASEGIAEWRAASGGVFTIPIAELVDLMDKASRSPAP